MKFLREHWIWVFTATYFVMFGTICYLKKPWSLEANAIGDFLAGFFSPLALLWLVAGYYQNRKAISIQSAELKHSVDALNLQAKELSETNKHINEQNFLIRATELHARRDVFIKILDIANEQLDAYISEFKIILELNVSTLRLGVFINKEMKSGNPLSGKTDDVKSLFLSTRKNYCELFNKLLLQASFLDEDDFFQESLYRSERGSIFFVLKSDVFDKILPLERE